MRWTHLPAFEYRRERWQNGLGWTREILRSPPDPGEAFDWRVSIGEIDRDADFSVFAGCERELVLLTGEGLSLSVDDEASTIEPPHGRLRFSGEARVSANLTNGPVHVFNVIWRRDRVRCTLLHRPLVGPMVFFDETGVDWLIHLIAGRAELKDTPACPPIEAGDSLWLQADAAGARRHILSGGGELLALRVECDAAHDSTTSEPPDLR